MGLCRRLDSEGPCRPSPYLWKTDQRQGKTLLCPRRSGVQQQSRLG